jgi:hypothetical protein
MEGPNKKKADTEHFFGQSLLAKKTKGFIALSRAATCRAA